MQTNTNAKKTLAEKACIYVISLACVLLIFAFMFLSVQAMLYSKVFYNWQFNKNDSYNELELSKEQLHSVRDKLIDYFKNKTDDLQVYVTFDGEYEPEPFYTEDELSHMQDTKKVFRGFFITSYIFIAVALTFIAVSYFYTLRNQKSTSFNRIYAEGAIIGSSVFLFMGMLLLLCLILFFTQMFSIFHDILFPQGNWMFYDSSNMIRMLPETLFYNAAVIIVSVGFISAVSFLISGIFLIRKVNNK